MLCAVGDRQLVFGNLERAVSYHYLFDSDGFCLLSIERMYIIFIKVYFFGISGVLSWSCVMKIGWLWLVSYVPGGWTVIIFSGCHRP